MNFKITACLDVPDPYSQKLCLLYSETVCIRKLDGIGSAVGGHGFGFKAFSEIFKLVRDVFFMEVGANWERTFICELTIVAID